ncbi:SDR family oxidoreductase [Phytoactinopolyspora halotolerans]|uniref:NAD(P)H-binding protein n=1 Tax=Phytoactinopolyspora halotolerans TaxID=1981512 RepID=A0A6L9S1G5_9ACTN|nr:NAD(P)H-binding protein [Phytoactinopolyspora halotolerans]NED98660.1 NAD(P)H-binding protein [Phytoactinopolyspora halotolerans]
MAILVTGATGSVGRRVVDQLLAAGADDVRALTTNPTKAALPASVHVVEGYVGRPESLPPALHGVDRMYLAPAPETAAAAAALAAQAGVRHIVDLSGPEESWWYSVAKAVEESGASWTHLWPGEFMENSTVWAEQVRRTGMVRDAYPDAANAPIAMDDVARIAATCLLGENHEGQSYLLTGPETLSRRELIDRIAAALGRDVPVLRVGRDEAVEQLTPAMGEYAAWYVDGTAELATSPQPVSATFENVMGRPGTTFAEWVAAHVDEFR